MASPPQLPFSWRLFVLLSPASLNGSSRQMSENSQGSVEKIDPRVVRTRDKLGDALIALLIEKSFDAVTVQDVLDRAGVSRSTFYAHYRDKNDLFLSDVDQFLESMATLLERAGDRSG